MMKKNLLFVALLAMQVGIFTGCTGTKGKSTTSSEETFSGLVGEATSMHVLQVILGNDTLNFQMDDACDKSQGNLVIGNLVDVIYTKVGDANVALKVVGNTTYVNALGRWTSPIPGQTGEEGVELAINGVASSIHMHTLLYKTWGITDEANQILLAGESIGNGVTIEFLDTAVIKQVDEKWILEIANKGIVYTKE
ncbi:MAG: lipocalin family protein [Phocaeicola sp.]